MKLKNLQQFFCVNKNKNIFLLSHMRSRSSVFSHVLGSNDEILGYGERQISYGSKFSLIRRNAKIVNNLQIKTTICDKYIYDKILHNHLWISDDLLKNPNNHIIIMIRSPVESVQSILNMGIKINEEQYTKIDWVEKYYIDRLKKLEDYSNSIKGKFIFIESDNLVYSTDNILEELTDWLGLKVPLKSEYKTFNSTGKSGHGDPLENIHAGKIIRTKSHDIEIPDEIKERLETAYIGALSILANNAKKSFCG